ncbi:MAG: ribonuclease P protein component 4 [Thermoproteota archaeon]
MPGKNKRGYKIRSAVRTIAGERIDILLSQAREMLDRDPKLSKRYVELARKISMRTKVRIPSSQKRYLCKGCGTILIPGRNARVRVLAGNPRIVITCLSCGALRRYPFTKNRNIKPTNR